ncbi:MAG: hypothetical protein AB8B51_07665 [Sedimentitalea sp.]
MNAPQKQTQGPNARLPYLIAAVILTFACYCGLLVWVASRPPQALSTDNKVFTLLILIALPGKQALDAVYDKYDLRERMKNRLSAMAFSGLLIGLFRAAEASGPWTAALTFVSVFAAACIAFLVLDYTVDWLWSRWKNR